MMLEALKGVSKFLKSVRVFQSNATCVGVTVLQCQRLVGLYTSSNEGTSKLCKSSLGHIYNQS